MGAPRHPVRILLVDDDRSSRFLVRAVLDDHTGRVVIAGEAGDATEALVALDACEPDVVVLDAVMPLVDGYALAAEVRARRPWVGILVLSAFVDGPIEARALAAGADACLDKAEFDAIGTTVAELAELSAGRKVRAERTRDLLERHDPAEPPLGVDGHQRPAAA